MGLRSTKSIGIYSRNLIVKLRMYTRMTTIMHFFSFIIVYYVIACYTCYQVRAYEVDGFEVLRSPLPIDRLEIFIKLLFINYVYIMYLK